MIQEKETTTFVPVGAVAFFVALLLSFIIVWFGLYALMVLRG